jgi:acyl carrier protein
MISKEEIIRQVDLALCGEFELEPSQLRPQATLYEDLGLDSLDAVDIGVVLEQAFGMKMTFEKNMLEVATLEDLYLLVIRLFKEAREKTGH